MIIVYLMVLWFSILLFSDKKYFWCSVIVLASSLSNIIIVDWLELTEPMSYIQEQGFLIKLDGLTAIVLTSFYLIDKLALRMSLLLAFSVLCHIMITYHKMDVSSFLVFVFYFWYDELIMMIGIIQMLVSMNGINSALRKIRDYILRAKFYCYCYSKSIFLYKKSGART